MEMNETDVITRLLRHLGEDKVALLKAPTPPEVIEERKIRGGGMVSYIPGSWFIERMNEIFGFLWDYEVIHEERDKDQIVAKGQVTVRIPGYTLTRKSPDGMEESFKVDGIAIRKTQFGGSDVKKKSGTGEVMDLADDYKAAGTDAFKKCCTLLGLGLDVYSSREESNTKGGPSKQTMETLTHWGEKLGWDKDKIKEYCSTELSKPFEEVTDTEALGLLPKLREKAQGGA